MKTFELKVRYKNKVYAVDFLDLVNHKVGFRVVAKDMQIKGISTDIKNVDILFI